MKFLIIFLTLIVTIYCDCDKDWTFLSRKKGGWCVKAFKEGGDYAKAEKFCETQNAVVSSVESQAEFFHFAELLRKFKDTSYAPTSWIGARLSDWCYDQKIKLDEIYIPHDSCTRTTGYNWTDGFTEGVAGFEKWLFPLHKLYSKRKLSKRRLGMYFDPAIGLADFDDDDKCPFLVCGKRAKSFDV